MSEHDKPAYVKGTYQMTARIVERKEDMSPDGRLRLYLQPDGDVIVSVLQAESNLDDACEAHVEFCTPFFGGGGSKRTHKALQALFKAMEEDNADAELLNRRGEQFASE